MDMPKKLVLVTGATRGLGRAMVEEFARLGHTVLGCGRSKEEIERLRKTFPPPHAVDAEVAPYCATKWAIEGLTLALAQELPSGMAAVPLNPGVINTDMLQSSFGKSASGYMRAPEWAKKAVPFLLALGPPDNGHQLT